VPATFIISRATRLALFIINVLLGKFL